MMKGHEKSSDKLSPKVNALLIIDVQEKIISAIFNKDLKKPEDKKMPFFSLIGISKKDNWLCARGRGGGLAIWVKS